MPDAQPDQYASYRTVKFLAALAVLATLNTLLRWPANTGRAHWSEWFVFYFSPAFTYAGILLLAFYVVQRIQLASGARQSVRLPLVGIFLAVAIFMSVGLIVRLLA